VWIPPLKKYCTCLPHSVAVSGRASSLFTAPALGGYSGFRHFAEFRQRNWNHQWALIKELGYGKKMPDQEVMPKDTFGQNTWYLMPC
jgi:hypothetical protein